MNFSNLHIRTLFVFALAAFFITSCEDYNDLELQAPDGDADFSQLVAVGNSLTAGYQNNALYETGQRYSFPALVAGQIETVQNFEQPLISDPGIGEDPGRIELVDVEQQTTQYNTDQGSPINTGLGRPYNNLGVPGAVLADFIGQNLPNLSYQTRYENNPLFNVILREMGTQAEQMAELNPSFVLFSLGNNDVLGYVTSGGTTSFTPVETFEGLYAASIQKISETGADAILYTIPDITSLPFVFYTNFQLSDNGIIDTTDSGNFYMGNEDNEIFIESTTSTGSVVVEPMNARNVSASQPGDYILLSAGSSVLQNYGTQDNPIPNNFVLDDLEILSLQGNINIIDEYNAIIKGQADSNGFGVVDLNRIFADIVATGAYQQNDIILRPVPGELFSFDGIHPSNQGYGVLANATIEQINETYNTNIPLIDISTIPRGLPANN